MREFRISGLVVALVAAVTAAACSDGAMRSPVAPSALAAAPEATAGVPTGDRSAVSPDRVADWAVNTGWSTAADGLMVEGSDVISAVSGACPDRTVTVRGVPVMMNSATVFGPGVSCRALAAGTRIHIAGLLMVTGGAYSVIATAITVDQPPPAERGGTGGDGGQGRTSGEGTVAAVRGNCPTLTLVIRGYSVLTSEATTYAGGSCSNLRPGARVVVSGVEQANALMAETVEFRE